MGTAHSTDDENPPLCGSVKQEQPMQKELQLDRVTFSLPKDTIKFAYHSNGMLAVATANGLVKLIARNGIDVILQQQLNSKIVKKSNSIVTFLFFVNMGKKLVVVTQDSNIKLFDLVTLSLWCNIVAEWTTCRITAVYFPDHSKYQYLYIALDDGTIRVLNYQSKLISDYTISSYETGQSSECPQTGEPHEVVALDIHPFIQSNLLIGYEYGDIVLFNIGKRRAKKAFARPASFQKDVKLTALKFAPNGKQYGAGYSDGTIIICRINSGVTSVQTVINHPSTDTISPITNILWGSSQSMIISGGTPTAYGYGVTVAWQLADRNHGVVAQSLDTENAKGLWKTDNAASMFLPLPVEGELVDLSLIYEMNFYLLNHLDTSFQQQHPVGYVSLVANKQGHSEVYIQPLPNAADNVWPPFAAEEQRPLPQPWIFPNELLNCHSHLVCIRQYSLEGADVRVLRPFLDLAELNQPAFIDSSRISGWEYPLGGGEFEYNGKRHSEYPLEYVVFSHSLMWTGHSKGNIGCWMIGNASQPSMLLLYQLNIHDEYQNTTVDTIEVCGLEYFPNSHQLVVSLTCQVGLVYQVSGKGVTFTCSFPLQGYTISPDVLWSGRNIVVPNGDKVHLVEIVEQKETLSLQDGGIILALPKPMSTKAVIQLSSELIGVLTEELSLVIFIASTGIAKKSCELIPLLNQHAGSVVFNAGCKLSDCRVIHFESMFALVLLKSQMIVLLRHDEASNDISVLCMKRFDFSLHNCCALVRKKMLLVINQNRYTLIRMPDLQIYLTNVIPLRHEAEVVEENVYLPTSTGEIWSFNKQSSQELTRYYSRQQVENMITLRLFQASPKLPKQQLQNHSILNAFNSSNPITPVNKKRSPSINVMSKLKKDIKQQVKGISKQVQGVSKQVVTQATHLTDTIIEGIIKEEEVNLDNLFRESSHRSMDESMLNEFVEQQQVISSAHAAANAVDALVSRGEKLAILNEKTKVLEEKSIAYHEKAIDAKKNQK